jgi:CxxC motif-containing protein (DUF1111 family)
MKILKVTVISIFVLAAALTFAFKNSVKSQDRSAGSASQSDDRIRQQRFRHSGVMDDEDYADRGDDRKRERPTEAPAGFDNQTNGFNEQGPDFDTLNEDNVVALRSFNDNRFIFDAVETVADGIGPTYNAQSCRECHQNVVTGGASQVTVQRTGRLVGGVFFESLGGSLIHSRATHPDIVERVSFEDDIRTFRISTNTLGNGFVEAIANETILAIQNQQPRNMRGSVLLVPVFEGNGNARLGRFGWKNQHASLESFSADAYLNEMGITSPTFPEENTSGGIDVSQYDTVADPEDDGVDIVAFANFMRSTKVPSRGPITRDVQVGERLFNQIGCAVCHTETIVTARPGTVINNGALTVPNALGNKVIHPYSDFLLHDIGTGDGIPFLPTGEYAFTANMIRTAPLWALRTRNRLMHDGLSFTLQEAIMRHAGQASSVTSRYDALSVSEKEKIIAFLNSL